MNPIPFGQEVIEMFVNDAAYSRNLDRPQAFACRFAIEI